MKTNYNLIGPFTQLLTMNRMDSSGPLNDADLEIIPNGGIRILEDKIVEIGNFDQLKKYKDKIIPIEGAAVGMPGFIDAHTHACFAGYRAHDYSQRLSGSTYQEIAAKGGGIRETVVKTRATPKEELTEILLQRAKMLLRHGVTTCEVKSGYGLSVKEEIKILEAIKDAQKKSPIDLIPTCLAAHTRPVEFTTNKEYLQTLTQELLPQLLKRKLARRIDIFIDSTAFSVDEARLYLQAAKKQGFDICIHADQFMHGGAALAAELHALSADHLEVSTIKDALAMKRAGVIPIVLPGATLGLGMPFPPARMLLDAGLPLVIASDWNPGSAPMGDILTQAALLGAAQKLTIAETFAAVTSRAAKALKLNDRGLLKKGYVADIIAFPCAEYEQILYYQGAMKPYFVLKNEHRHD